PRAIAALATILLAVGALSFYSQWSGRFMPRTPYLIAGIYSAVPSPRTDSACRARFPTHGEYCQQYDAARPVTTALLGNSHAEHFLEGVGAHLAAKGENVVHLGQSGCAPLADLQRFVNDTNDTCVTPDNAVIDLVARSPQITRVILSFNGTVMANGTGTSGGYEVMELAGTLLPPDESIRVALERTARRFLEAGKSVWLILQVPEMEFQIQECFARPFSFEHRVLTPCATPLAHVVAREAKYRQIVKEA